MKRYKPLLKENEKNVIDFLKRRFSSNTKHHGHDEDLGDEIDFIFGTATIQIWIKEEENKVYLNGISTKHTDDPRHVLSGSGKGTDIINLLKEYSDKTNKKFIVPGALTNALPFWNKIKWLKRDYEVYMIFDGKPENPKNTFSYTPKGYHETI